MAKNREYEYRPARKKVNKLAKPFLAINCQNNDLYPLFPNIQNKSSNDVIRKVRGDKSYTKYDFANEISAALQFPQDFNGRSWDAFDEFVNNLDWLPILDNFLLIITDANELLSKDSYREFEVLMRILKDAAKNWGSGANHDILVRAYQEEVVPKKSKFAVVYQFSPDADLSGNFGSWLKEADIPIVDNSIFDINISDVIDVKPFHDLGNFVHELASDYAPIMDKILQGQDVKREDVTKLFRALESKILPYRNSEGVTDPKMAHLNKIIRDIGRQL